MATTDPNLMTQADYARHRKLRGLPGGSREAVRKAVEEGRISAFGPDKLIDHELADVHWERNTRARISPEAAAVVLPGPAQALVAAPIPPAAAEEGGALRVPAGDTYQDARKRREIAEAEIAEMESRKRAGQLLDREGVTRALFEIARELRDRLRASGKRIAAEVAGLQSVEACEATIDREHLMVLEQLVTQLQEKLPAVVQPGGSLL